MSRTQEEIEEKISLITGNLLEVVGENDIREILKERDMKIYWGTAPTGAPHMGYFVPMMKIGDFLKAGQNVTILFADIHAVLDNLKSTFELVQKRTEYYKFLIQEMLKLVNVPLEKLKFVTGSSFQYSREYTKQMYKVAAMTTLRQSKHAGADVVKHSKDPLLSGLLYPILQALDEEFLGVDAQFGGVDQRKIFMFAREFLPKVGFKKRVHLMNALIPGLTKSGKMSSSVPNSKIDFFDSDETIRKKIKKAYSVDGQPEKNSLLALLRYVLMPRLKSIGKEKFVVKVSEEFGGGVLEFSTFEEIWEAFAEKKLVSGDLKPAVADHIVEMISPLREILLKNQHLYDVAYPKEEKMEQKEKKSSPWDNFVNEWVEKKKAEFPNLKGKKLVTKIRKEFKIGAIWGKMGPEERKKYE